MYICIYIHIYIYAYLILFLLSSQARETVIHTYNFLFSSLYKQERRTFKSLSALMLLSHLFAQPVQCVQIVPVLCPCFFPPQFSIYDVCK